MIFVKRHILHIPSRARVMLPEFESDEWKTDSDDYLTYIYRKSF